MAASAQLGRGTALIEVLVRAAKTSVWLKSCKMQSRVTRFKAKTEQPGITGVLFNTAGPARLTSNQMIVTRQQHKNAGLRTFQAFPSPMAGRSVRPEMC